MNSVKLQVFFEGQFWIGVFERLYDGKLSVCRVIFGPEPKDYEILEFILENYYNVRFSPAVESDVVVKEKINPKRLQRDIKKQVQNVEIGTKSQQALKLLQEENKFIRKIRTREQKEEEKEFQFELKKQKRKEKHKGR
nr:YjdF family protein [[Clostridium] fimetarium]